MTVPGTTATPPTLVSKEPPFIFELLFQGQANDVNIAVNVVNANDEQWVDVPTVSNNTVTYTETLEAASPVVATLGDYAGEQGSNQSNAALAMDSEGDMVAAYTNQPLQTDGSSPIDANGDITDQGIYAEQLDETTNIAGPQVVDWTDSNGTDLLKGGTAVGVDSQYFVLTFDQAMLADNPALDSDSVFDLANYQLYNANGTLMTNAFTTANYGLSEVAAMATSTPGFTTNLDSYIPDNKFEVVLTLNSTLPNGTYTLEVLNAIRATSTSAGQTGLANIYGSPLNLTGYNPSGSDFIETVTISGSLNPGTAPVPPGLTATDTPVNAIRGGMQIDPSVATSASGDYVVVWTSVVGGQTNIVGQLYKSSGTEIGTEFTVNQTASTSWSNPSVAMDSDGAFVVTWSGAGPGSNATFDPSDVYARQFNAYGQAVTSQFLVDLYVAGAQQPGTQAQSTVAMAPDGTYVIAWSTTPITVSNENTPPEAIYAREYSSAGAPLSNEFQVSSSSAGYAQSLPDVAMDANDDFVVVWEGDEESSQWGVYGDYFTSNGSSTSPAWSSTGPKLLNNSPNTRSSFSAMKAIDLHDTGPRVAMDLAGAFVVTWANFVNPTEGYDIFAQQFAPAPRLPVPSSRSTTSARPTRISVGR